MIRLVPAAPREDRPLLRTWLVFFSNPSGSAWWTRFMRDGYRHVCAAAWFAHEECWVVFDPTRRGVVIEVWHADEFDARLGDLALRASVVLRVKGQFERKAAPAAFWCVGAVKALLGIRCLALTPFGLCRDLRRRGAEFVDVPCVVTGSDVAASSGHVEPVQVTAAPARGPCRRANASGGAGARRARP